MADKPADMQHRDKETFHGHETARMESLEGVRLAGFGRRVVGYVIDIFIAAVISAPLEVIWKLYVLHEHGIIRVAFDFHEPWNLVGVVGYLGLANYLGNGQTPGKWVAKTRAVSLVSERLGLWQSVERALGYGAAVLEGGLGFLQYFWSPNRMCAQDRLAETIVVDVRKSEEVGK